MICIIALVVFSIMGIFSLTYRNLAKEAFDCVFRRITFRPCNTGFNEKIKSQLVAKLLNKSVFAARIFNKYFEVFSWAFLISLPLQALQAFSFTPFSLFFFRRNFGLCGARSLLSPF